MQENGGEHQHDDRVTSVGFEVGGMCDWPRLNVWLRNLLMEQGADIFRSKGILSVDGTDDK